MRILVDADTIVEILLNRSGIVEKIESLWSLLEERQIEAYLSDIGVDKIRSLAERITDPISAHEIVSTIQSRFRICPVDEMILQEVRLSALEDYESAVEVSCALAVDIGAIVTHRPSDFARADLSIVSVGDLKQRQHYQRLCDLKAMTNSAPSDVFIGDGTTATLHESALIDLDCDFALYSEPDMK